MCEVNEHSFKMKTEQKCKPNLAWNELEMLLTALSHASVPKPSKHRTLRNTAYNTLTQTQDYCVLGQSKSTSHWQVAVICPGTSRRQAPILWCTLYFRNTFGTWLRLSPSMYKNQESIRRGEPRTGAIFSSSSHLLSSSPPAPDCLCPRSASEQHNIR